METTLQVANVARFALALAVMVAYWTPLFEAVRPVSPTTATTSCSASSSPGSRSPRSAPMPACSGGTAGRNGRLPAIFISWGVAAAILHVTVPDRIEGRIPRRQAIVAGVATAMIIMLIVGSIVTRGWN